MFAAAPPAIVRAYPEDQKPAGMRKPTVLTAADSKPACTAVTASVWSLISACVPIPAVRPAPSAKPVGPVAASGAADSKGVRMPDVICAPIPLRAASRLRSAMKSSDESPDSCNACAISSAVSSPVSAPPIFQAAASE